MTADADDGELSSITSTIPDLEVQRTVDENPSDLKRYGLDPAGSKSVSVTRARRRCVGS